MSDYMPPKMCNGCDNPTSLCVCDHEIVPSVLWIAPSDVSWLRRNKPEEMDVAIPFSSSLKMSAQLEEAFLLINKAAQPGTWLDGSDEVLRVIEKARDILADVLTERIVRLSK